MKDCESVLQETFNIEALVYLLVEKWVLEFNDSLGTGKNKQHAQ